MFKLFLEAGMPRRRPPVMPACAVEDSSEAPHIISPRLGVSSTIRGSQPEGAIALEASAAADVRTMFWFDGTALIGKVTDLRRRRRPPAPPLRALALPFYRHLRGVPARRACF